MLVFVVRGSNRTFGRVKKGGEWSKPGAATPPSGCWPLTRTAPDRGLASTLGCVPFSGESRCRMCCGLGKEGEIPPEGARSQEGHLPEAYSFMCTRKHLLLTPQYAAWEMSNSCSKNARNTENRKQTKTAQNASRPFLNSKGRQFFQRDYCTTYACLCRTAGLHMRLHERLCSCC